MGLENFAKSFFRKYPIYSKTQLNEILEVSILRKLSQININSECAFNDPLLSEPVFFYFAVKMKKIDIWKIDVPQMSRPCHKKSFFGDFEPGDDFSSARIRVDANVRFFLYRLKNSVHLLHLLDENELK